MALLNVATLKHFRAATKRGWVCRAAADHMRHNLASPINNDDRTTQNLVRKMPQCSRHLAA